MFESSVDRLGWAVAGAGSVEVGQHVDGALPPGVLESADSRALKALGPSGMRVRVPPPAPTTPLTDQHLPEWARPLVRAGSVQGSPRASARASSRRPASASSSVREQVPIGDQGDAGLAMAELLLVRLDAGPADHQQAAVCRSSYSRNLLRAADRVGSPASSPMASFAAPMAAEAEGDELRLAQRATPRRREHQIPRAMRPIDPVAAHFLGRRARHAGRYQPHGSDRPTQGRPCGGRLRRPSSRRQRRGGHRGAGLTLPLRGSRSSREDAGSARLGPWAIRDKQSAAS